MTTRDPDYFLTPGQRVQFNRVAEARKQEKELIERVEAEVKAEIEARVYDARQKTLNELRRLAAMHVEMAGGIRPIPTATLKRAYGTKDHRTIVDLLEGFNRGANVTEATLWDGLANRLYVNLLTNEGVTYTSPGNFWLEDQGDRDGDPYFAYAPGDPIGVFFDSLMSTDTVKANAIFEPWFTEFWENYKPVYIAANPDSWRAEE